MERFSQRENFSAQRSFEGPSSLPDVDFNDVFGGPPRRFSLQEGTRYISYGSMDTDETALFRSLSSEKPVFGEESSSSSSSVNGRKHHQSNDFFDDIFQGDKYSCTSPRRDFLNSFMSPWRPLPPKSEPFGTLVPAQFSLAATLKNYPKFGSSSSSFMKKEGTSPNSLLSRFSRQSIQQGQDDCRNDAFPSNRPSPLSNAESSSHVTKSNETEMRGINSKGNSKPEVLENFPQERKTISPTETTSLSEKTTEKNISMVKEEEAREPELKSLRSILQDEIERLDNADNNLKGEGGKNLPKTTQASPRSNAGGRKNVKKHQGKKINTERAEVNKANMPGSPKFPGGNLKRSGGVRGKVKDFAKIFNQETYSKSKRNASSRWEGKVSEAASISTTEMNFLDMNKMPDSFFMVNENVEKPEKSKTHSCNQKEASQFSDSIPDVSKLTSHNINDPFHENYLIQDLSDDQVKLPRISEDLEATKALDAKILKWSTGKIGNIRLLLSTLQYVLWAESGWNPVPLVNIIEGNAVKRAYQKALLCLHPDKLQQKGAASHQKYIAEKVFDILQEAWDHFNSFGSI